MKEKTIHIIPYATGLELYREPHNTREEQTLHDRPHARGEHPVATDTAAKQDEDTPVLPTTPLSAEAGVAARKRMATEAMVRRLEGCWGQLRARV